MKREQITDTILMVRPKHFGYNAQTAENNAFQTNDTSISENTVAARAIEEFDHFVEKLRAHDIEVIVAQDSDEPIKMDAVFPNNWVSFHKSNTCVIYPVFAPSRRLERSAHVLSEVFKRYPFFKHIDLTHLEKEELFLEGTGSMILDRPNRIAYACVSPRTHEVAVESFCKMAEYEKVLFRATDRDGIEVYHTNVMMALGEDFVVICMDSIKNPQERAMLEASFSKTGKTIIDITFDQMYAFAGNMLQVKSKTGQKYLVMSEQAFHSLSEEQIKRIETFTHILHTPLYTIETNGGGSARCMMAEVFY